MRVEDNRGIVSVPTLPPGGKMLPKVDEVRHVEPAPVSMLKPPPFESPQLAPQMMPSTQTVLLIPDKRPELQTYKSQRAGSTDDELEKITDKTRRVEEEHDILRQKKESAKDKYRKIKAEYDKDYTSYEQELNNEQERLGIDESIIEYYRDKDVEDVEKLLGEAKRLLKRAEEHIKFYIELKQEKEKEIEDKTSAK